MKSSLQAGTHPCSSNCHSYFVIPAEGCSTGGVHAQFKPAPPDHRTKVWNWDREKSQDLICEKSVHLMLLSFITPKENAALVEQLPRGCGLGFAGLSHSGCWVVAGEVFRLAPELQGTGYFRRRYE